ncbi:hypothetical protein RUND412_008317, partial [Rhizina undulata]
NELIFHLEPTHDDKFNSAVDINGVRNVFYIYGVPEKFREQLLINSGLSFEYTPASSSHIPPPVAGAEAIVDRIQREKAAGNPIEAMNVPTVAVICRPPFRCVILNTEVCGGDGDWNWTETLTMRLVSKMEEAHLEIEQRSKPNLCISRGKAFQDGTQELCRKV